MINVQIKPDIYWVGAVDWPMRDFHGYVTPRGSTYNNYLIMDEQVTLLDAVRRENIAESMERISRLTDLGEIKNIIVNHIELDHSGGLDVIVNNAPHATIYCTGKGRKGLLRMFKEAEGWNFKTVKSGDTLGIGKRTLTFLETPMIHWPDSMMTYIAQDKLLISQDAFGQHLATSERFDDEFIKCENWAELKDSVWEYYANILMPLGALIKRKIEELQALGLPIDMIAPDHGVIWRKDPEWIMQEYLDMANGKAEERVVIIYDTMWHSTENMTHAISEGLQAEGMDTRVLKLRSTPTSVAIKEFWQARGCLIGSPTINNTIMPAVGEFMVYLEGLRPKNRITGAFGSYGWGGGAVKKLNEWTTKMGLKTVEPGLQSNYHRGKEDEEACFEFGRDFALKLREYHKQFPF